VLGRRPMEQQEKRGAEWQESREEGGRPPPGRVAPKKAEPSKEMGRALLSPSTAEAVRRN
jgi:hypothetical protein